MGSLHLVLDLLDMLLILLGQRVLGIIVIGVLLGILRGCFLQVTDAVEA